LSWLAVTICDPSGLNDAEAMSPECFRVNTSAPVVASHTFAGPHLVTVTIRDPSGLNDAEPTPEVCLASVRSFAPLIASHTLAYPSSFGVQSTVPVTIRDPSGLKDAALTLPWGFSVSNSTPVFASHTFAVL